MKYVMGMVILGCVCLASASPVGVYYTEDFSGTTLNADLWNATNVTMGKRLTDKWGNTAMEPGYVMLDGWDPGAELIGIVKVHPEVGQTVVLSVSDIVADAWPAGTGWGFDGIRVAMGNWSWNSDANVDIEIGSQKKSNVHTNELMLMDWTINWSPDRITVVSGTWGTIFDTATMAPDAGGSWVIPTTDQGFYAYNYYQGAMSLSGVKLEVVPEPVTLVMLAVGSFGLIRRR
jgi:hypothetical protein